MAVYIFAKGKRDGSSGTSRQERMLRKYVKSIGLSDEIVNVEDNWDKLKNTLQNGDILISKDISALAKDPESGCDIYEDMLKKDVTLLFVDSPNLGTDYINLLQETAEKHKFIVKNNLSNVIKLLIAVEYERIERIRKHRSNQIKAGMNIAKKKPGREVGKVDKLTDDLKRDISLYLENGSMLMIELMDKHGVSRNTLKKYIEIIRNGMIE